MNDLGIPVEPAPTPPTNGQEEVELDPAETDRRANELLAEENRQLRMFVQSVIAANSVAGRCLVCNPAHVHPGADGVMHVWWNAGGTRHSEHCALRRWFEWESQQVTTFGVPNEEAPA